MSGCAVRRTERLRCFPRAAAGRDEVRLHVIVKASILCYHRYRLTSHVATRFHAGSIKTTMQDYGRELKADMMYAAWLFDRPPREYEFPVTQWNVFVCFCFRMILYLYVD